MGYYWAICQCPWGFVSQSPVWLPTPHTFSESSGKHGALHPSPSFSALESSRERHSNRIQLRYNFISSVPSLFHSNKEIFNENLMRNKEQSPGLCMQGEVETCCILMKWRVWRPVWSSGGCSQSFVKTISCNFFTLLSDIHFRSCLLVVLAESYIALDNLKSWLILEPFTR